MIPEDIFLKIVRSAVRSPSGHNTQPWFFAKEGQCICIKPDINRALPIADPENRELFISLGCATETAMIAARFYGYQAELNNDLLENQGTIQIILSKNDALEQPELFSYINSRQTTRNLYGKTPISDDDLIQLKQAVGVSDIAVEFYTGEEKIKTFLPYIFEANRIQMSNPNFKNELIRWLRFSEKEAMQKGDGLYMACSGLPPMGRLLGGFVVKNFVTAKREEKRIARQVCNTNLVAMFITQNNTFSDWVRTGIIFQRFALTCAKLGLSHSFINFPCQVSQVRDKMISDMSLIGFPQLIIRLGYSPRNHFSFRRRINDVIVR
jgi:hypothetical protein